MIDSFLFAYECINTASFLLLTVLFSFIVKTYLLTIIIPYGLRSSTIRKPWFFLLGTLIGSLCGDITWFIKLLREMQIAPIAYSTLVLWVRLSWALLIMQYQSLAFFIESLTQKNFKLHAIHKLLLLLSSCCALYFIGIAAFDTSLTDPITRTNAMSILDMTQAPLEKRMIYYVDCYLLHSLIALGVLFTLKNLYTQSLPKILTKQVKTALAYFICPYIITEILQSFLIAVPTFGNNTYFVVTCSTLIMTYGMYFCIHQIMVLRFLNSEDHVRSTYNTDFFNHFKITLEHLSHIANKHELITLTQTFFKDTFAIGLRQTTLYIRSQAQHSYSTQLHEDSSRQYTIETIVETFMAAHSATICAFIKQRRILIYDELEFSNFYEDQEMSTTILTFMNSINADIFIPIYDNTTMTAYILVEKNARTKLYGNVEHDEMLIYANYLSSIINLLQHRNLTTFMHKEKELKEELLHKKQEIDQYKESLKSFLRTSAHKEIGIIFYKNKRFIFGNKSAKKIVTTHHNTIDGHPLSKAIQKIAQQVSTYKLAQTTMVILANNNKLMIYGVPNIEHNNTIIMLYQPELSDILTRKVPLLKDPTKWDYLLYLETTRSGQLINQLIPGSGQTLLNFKIDLLKTALSQKAILLEMPQEDLIPTVEIIHHISLREKLHVITCSPHTDNNDIFHQLFGINPLIKPLAPKPLLSELNSIGTLLINNIEYLPLETQRALAEFLTCGSFRLYGGEQHIITNVRIICTSESNLQALVQEDKFCKELFEELNKTFLSMPALTTLPDQELNKLAEELSSQTIKSYDLQNVLTLTDKEKAKLSSKRPESLESLRTRIQEIVLAKSKKSLVYHETPLIESSAPKDPELAAASLLGRKALRNQQVMTMLWQRFKNQNQIATFLGVNRSSINRRCKEYGLE